jgi:hypothetical protein
MSAQPPVSPVGAALMSSRPLPLLCPSREPRRKNLCDCRGAEGDVLDLRGGAPCATATSRHRPRHHRRCTAWYARAGELPGHPSIPRVIQGRRS